MENSVKPNPPLRVALIACVLLGACLLFQLEPLAGKIITPRFGGTAGTWSVCLLFFQLAVLGGYGLTWAFSRLDSRHQIQTFVALALTSLVWCNVPEPSFWRYQGGDPALEVLGQLLEKLALPSLFLASISGTMQVWYRRARLGDPYPLYAFSNIGSLGALLCYPALVEPALTVTQTLKYWSYGYMALTVLVVLCAVAMWRLCSRSEEREFTEHNSSDIEKDPDDAGAGAVGTFVWWVFLSAAGTLVLMSYTAYMTADIAPIPLLWVLPLAVYLLSFVLVFSGKKFYRPLLFSNIWIYIALFEPSLFAKHGPFPRIISCLLLIFLMCMICHGELAAAKPNPRRLPAYYFALSLGGVLAGAFVALIAPLLFQYDGERIIAIAMVIYITFAIVHHHRETLGRSTLASYASLSISSSGLLVLTLTALNPPHLVERARNFYSAVLVTSSSTKKELIHGRILHGEQSKLPGKAREPSSYYKGAVGLMDSFLRTQIQGSVPASLDIATIGLGTGTMASYGRRGDYVTFFELDPKIYSIAQRHFTYLADSPAHVKVELGDGRSLFEKLPPDVRYDWIFVDAFNGDAVPMHLLTKEAIATYKRHLKPNGILVFHVTNKYLSLPQPVAETARANAMVAVLLESPEHYRYVIVAQNPDVLSKLYAHTVEAGAKFGKNKFLDLPSEKSPKPWTDDYADVFGAFRLNP